MKEYLLTNSRGLSVLLNSCGAGVKSITLNGKRLILEPRTMDCYQNNSMYLGKTLGRVAGRTSGEISIGEKTFKLKADEDGITLHGGEKDSLSFKDFTGKTFASPDEKGVIFSYLSPDLENGYPGNLLLEVIYSLKEKENIFNIHYRAKSDKDTVLNISNHIYWSIDDGGLDNVSLFVDSSKIGKFYDTSLLLKDVEETDDLHLFKTLSPLKNKLDKIVSSSDIKTIDHTYVFDNEDENKEKVILLSDNIQVTCYTTYSACNIFCDLTRNELDLANGKHYKTMDRRAIAIEPQKLLVKDISLKAEEIYEENITYKITEVVNDEH